MTQLWEVLKSDFGGRVVLPAPAPTEVASSAANAVPYQAESGSPTAHAASFNAETLPPRAQLFEGAGRLTIPLAPLVEAPRRTRSAGTRFKLTRLRPGERKLIQALSDVVIAGGGLLPIVLSSLPDNTDTQVIVSLAVLSLLWFFFANAFDAYGITVLQSISRNVYAGLQTAVVTCGTYVLLATATAGLRLLDLPTLDELIMAGLLLAPLALVRALYSLLLQQAPLRRHLVIVGANETGYEMVQAVNRYGGTTYEFLGYFDDAPVVDGEANKVTAPLAFPVSDLLVVHETLGIDQIVLATHMRTPRLLSCLSICHERGIQITPMFALYQDLTGRVPVEHLGNDWFVALPAHRKSTPYILIKRLFDLTLASLLLLPTLPLLPLIALAIRLDSPGPIFFRQARVGLGGRPFQIVKFRSMRANAEASTGAVWARRGDPRITRLGRFLRKSRLDELPQLWNVLLGDMSFVGPRPERPEFDAELEANIPFYRARRAVRPGLTGWAQVCHGYGNTMQDALRKVEYDLYYIKNESLYVDLLILLRTIAVVFRLGGT